MSLPLLLGMTFSGILVLTLIVIWRPSEDPGSSKNRLEEVERYRVVGADVYTPPHQPVASLTSTVLTGVDAMLRSRGTKTTIAAELDRAGLRLHPQEWILLRLSTAATSVAVFFVLSGSLVIGTIAGVLIGWLGTHFYLKLKISRRSRAFNDQLPDTLQLVASSLRSGFSLLQALDGVVREGSEPMAGEFARALSDGRLGMDIEDALDRVAERMQCGDLTWVVMAIRISREVGGNLAETLMTTVHTMRERAQVKRQVRALSAEGRLSGIVLIGMPILIAGWLSISNPAYLQPLYTDPIGLAMLVFAGITLCIGAWWMSKIVNIEV